MMTQSSGKMRRAGCPRNGGGSDARGLRTDKKSRYAISKAIEVIGEEAGDVSKAFRLAHREIDGDGLIGMRHRLVRDYVRIRWERVWKLLQTEIPTLIVRLNRVIPPDPGDVEVT